jgi:hypothetical protein
MLKSLILPEFSQHGNFTAADAESAESIQAQKGSACSACSAVKN